MTSHLFVDQDWLDAPEGSGGESWFGGGVVGGGAWCNHDPTRLCEDKERELNFVKTTYPCIPYYYIHM